MIASLTGRVEEVLPDAAVIEVGGAGLLVQCTPATLASLRVGTVTTVATSLVVREDSLTLFGFADADEKRVFEQLLQASGVGPRLAQAVLSVLSPDALRSAVAASDLTTLTAVPGIGKKGAERIVVELRDRLGPPRGSVASVTVLPTAAEPWRGQVLEALVGLGWTTREAEAAVADLVPDDLGADGEPDLSALLRNALRTLRRA